MTKKIAILAVLLYVAGTVLLGACVGEKQETEILRKALYNGSDTIEASMNGIAGKDGSVSYYMPKEQPTNKTFRYLGVKVEKIDASKGDTWDDHGIANYIILVNTTGNSSEIDTLLFGSKIDDDEYYNFKFVFNSKGNGVDGMDMWLGIMEWGGASGLAIVAADSFYRGVKPEYIYLGFDD
jgi:hypothetical protein